MLSGENSLLPRLLPFQHTSWWWEPIKKYQVLGDMSAIHRFHLFPWESKPSKKRIPKVFDYFCFEAWASTFSESSCSLGWNWWPCWSRQSLHSLHTPKYELYEKGTIPMNKYPKDTCLVQIPNFRGKRAKEADRNSNVSTYLGVCRLNQLFIIINCLWFYAMNAQLMNGRALVEQIGVAAINWDLRRSMQYWI